MKKSLFVSVEEALHYLSVVGTQQDEDIDIFEASLALSLQEHPGKSVDQYRQHLNKLETEIKAEINRLADEDNLPDGLDARAIALRHVMTRVCGYAGDEENYDDLQNADLIRVVDRRLGLPITLCILALAVGKRLGWNIHGLDFPGHFMIRLDGDQGKRAILDPFHMFVERDAQSMRQLLKDHLGEGAELSTSYYESAPNRKILLRLQNNLKHRFIKAEDYQKALDCNHLMRIFAPNEPLLLFDEGILLAKLEQPIAAIDVLRDYMEDLPQGKDRMDTLAIINELNALLN